MVLIDDPFALQKEKERINRMRQKKPIDKSLAWTKGITGVLSGNESIIKSIGNEERFLEVSSKMNDGELALGIGTLIAFTLAGEAGTRAGKLSSKKVYETARVKGIKIDPRVEPKVEQAVKIFNDSPESTQLKGLQKIRQSSLDASREYRKDIRDPTALRQLDSEIADLEAKIKEGNRQLLQLDIDTFNKDTGQSRIINKKGEMETFEEMSARQTQEIADAQRVDLSGRMPELTKEQEAFLERTRESPFGDFVDIDEKGIPDDLEGLLTQEDIYAKQKSRTSEDIYAKQKSRTSEDLMKTDTKALDVERERNGLEEMEEPPDFGDVDETEPLLDRTETEMIDEAIERDKQTREAESKINKAVASGGSAVGTTALIENLTRQGEDNRRRMVEGVLGDFTDEPVKEGEPKTESITSNDNASSKTSIHSRYNIKETINVNNIHEVFETTIGLSKDAYDPDVNYQVDKYLVKGDFPVLFNKSGDTLYIAFRGTRNDFNTFSSSIESIRNMLIDLTTADLVGENTPLGDYDIFKASLPIEMAKLTGHKGFIEELAEYYQTLREEIGKYYNFVNHIVFTGHSAGAGIATLCYYVYENDFTIEDERINVEYTITYGSPRVVRDTFDNIELYNKKCKHLVRCFNANDIITYLPLKEPSSWGGSLVSGFIHLGKPLSMDTNIENNSLNALILHVLRGNKSQFDEIFKNYSLDEIRQNEIIGLITSDKYLSVMGQSLFQCYEKVAVKEDVTDEMLLQHTFKILTESEEILDYSLKCDLAKPLGVEEILKRNNIYESEVQQDVGISGVIASLMGYNKLSVKAHDLDTYKENSEKLKRREIETGTSYLEPITEELDTYPLPPKPIPVTTRKVYIDLIGEMVKDIESGKIVGAIEIDEDDLPALITF